MKIEYYQRLSFGVPAGAGELKDDIIITTAINEKILAFQAKCEEQSMITQIRIINVEHQYVPKPAFAPGNEYMLIVINLAYTY